MPPKTITKHLDPDLADFVAEQLAAGAYESEAELVADAVRQLRDRQHEALLSAVDEGEASGLSPLTHHEIMREVEERLRGQ